MRKSVTKIVKATVAFAMAIGAGVGAAMSSPKANPVDATANAWNQVTALADISNNDEIMIVNANYYLPAVNFTAKNSGGAAFDATDSTLANPVWKVTISNGSYKFSTVVSDTTYYLYVTNDNNGVVSGSGSTPAGKSWSIAKHSTQNTFMLTSSDGTNTRYLTYASGNFRCYKTSVSTGDKYCTLYKRNSVIPSVSVSPTTLFLRVGDLGQTVTATATNFSGAVSYSWAYRSGVDCVDLTNPSSATVTMTAKNSISEVSSGIYRVTVTHDTESAVADVNVTVDRGGALSPYTVAAARSAIDSGVGKTDAYVKGVVYQVDSYNGTYHSITYWISDDGSNSNPLEVYGGLAIEGGSDFASKDDIKEGDIVVVKGNLKKYSSTYEFSENNHLVSKISVASLAIKTAPTKTVYNSSEFFEPDGLVVTATYNDTPNPTTMDFEYDSGVGFSFSPSLTTALTNQESVSIGLFGQTVQQAITVNYREITGVVLDGDMTNKTYYAGDDWDLSGLYLTVSWSAGVPATTTINLDELSESSYDLDEDTPNKNTTSLYIYGVYEGFDFEKNVTGIVVHQRPIEDVLRSNSTSLNHTANSYASVEDITKTGHSDIKSEATYAGYYYCATNPNAGAIQLNPGKSTYICVTDSSQLLKSITINFKNANSNGVKVFVSNTAFSASYDAEGNGGTLLATSTESETINVTNDYKYFYIIPTGTTYVASITATWKFAKEQIASSVSTQTSLAYTNYTDNGNGTFSYENLGIRFGGTLSSAMWSRLDDESDIEGYGVLFTSFEYLNAQVDKDLKNYYASADGTNIMKYTNANTVHEPAAKATPTMVNGNYTWRLYFRVSADAFVKEYVAVAFIIIDGEVVFFDSVKASAGKLAYDLIDSGEYAAGDLGGSLKYLADLYEETL